MTLEIVRLLGHASLQGPPKFGSLKFGVPAGGAFDQESMALANALVGNAPDRPVLELAMAAAEFEFREQTVIALVGAPSPVLIDDEPRAANASFVLQPQAQLKFQPPATGARVYLALPGGVRRENQFIAALEPPQRLTPQRLADQPESLSTAPVRAIEGPHASLIGSSLFGTSFVVSHQSNRVGIRLAPTTVSHELELPSEPSCPGVMQLTPGGELIILGPDGPTIGGYPKVAVVCRADLDRLAQLRPGQELRVERITMAEARELEKQRKARLAKRLTELSLQVGL